MTRAERSDSRLFPTGDDKSGVFAGTTKDLSVEQAHLTGSKIIAGSLVTPTEEEGRFRYEIGAAKHRGVEFVGSATAGGNGVSTLTITPHANTAEGDLLVLFVHYSTVAATVGNDVNINFGWQRTVDWGYSSFNSFWGNIYTRRREAGDGSYTINIASDFVNTRHIAANLLTFRNAILHGAEDLLVLDQELAASTVISHGSGELDVPRGSFVVAMGGWIDTATGTVTPPSGFTETLDDARDVGGGVTFMGTFGSYKEILTEGRTSIGSGAFVGTGNFQQAHTAVLVVEPRSIGILGWANESGTETVDINEHGKARFKEFVGDLQVKGGVFSQRPFVMVCKPGDQTLSGGTQTEITWANPHFNDLGVFVDATDSMDFTVDQHRGLWRISLWIKWEFNASGRRLTELWYNGVGAVAAHNTHPAANAGSTWNHLEYYLPVFEDVSLTVECLQNSGGNLAVEGSTTQAETRWTAEFIRTID
jgi:hypothetical protein